MRIKRVVEVDRPFLSSPAANVENNRQKVEGQDRPVKRHLNHL